jgi:hypothetical protein
MRIRARSFSIAIAALAVLATAAMAESLVIVGTGRSGSWDTVLEISNSGSAAEIIQLGPTAGFQALCPNPCPLPSRTINPGQTIRLTPDDLSGYHPAFASISYVNSSDPSFTNNVSVRARSINTAVPTQSAEVPVVRLSTITALNPAVLSFPGATKSASAHSNLMLAEITGTAPAIIQVEAFDASGTRTGVSTETVPAGGTLYLVGVLSRLGVNAMDDGQIKVTRLSGGMVWGWIGTVFPDAGVHIGLGRNP